MLFVFFPRFLFNSPVSTGILIISIKQFVTSSLRIDMILSKSEFRHGKISLLCKDIKDFRPKYHRKNKTFFDLSMDSSCPNYPTHYSVKYR